MKEVNAKEGSKVKFSLNEDGKIHFKPPKNELATNLVKKLPIGPNKFNSGTIKG